MSAITPINDRFSPQNILKINALQAPKQVKKRKKIYKKGKNGFSSLNQRPKTVKILTFP